MTNKKFAVYVPQDLEVVAIATEFYGIQDKAKPNRYVAFRVSIVDGRGHVLCDECIEPSKKSLQKSKIRYSTKRGDSKKENNDGKEFAMQMRSIDYVREVAAKVLDGKYVVGHRVENALKVLRLTKVVPRRLIRDTSIYRDLREGMEHKKQHHSIKLRDLCDHHLSKKFLQFLNDDDRSTGSVRDARVSLELYKIFKFRWERNKDKYLAHFDQKYVPDYALEPLLSGDN